MMRRLFVFMMTVTLSVLSVHAQRMVSGKVIEQETQDAVIQATTSILSGEKVVANGVTNMDGAFRVKVPADGTYTLKITYVGFKTYTKKFTIKDGQDFRAGTISLAPDAIMLKGATVTARASKVTLKADTFVYNATAFRTPEGSVVEELVKRLPGAEVSDDGTIKMNGQEVKKILVDGKEFMVGDTKTALKNLPTNIIDRIKAYNQKSDLARVSGIDDGQEETVLDFGIKPGMNRGVMVNADLAAGTKDRYAGRVFGGVMQNDLKVFMMTNANNTNDMGFPGGGGGGRWGGGRQGLTATKMTGVNVNYEKKDKLKLDGHVRWNHSDGDAFSKRTSETMFSATSSQFGNNRTQNFTRSNNWSAQMRLEWMPDSMTNILFRPSFRYNSNDGDNNSDEATFTANPYDVAGINSPLDQKDKLLNILKNDRTQRSVSYSDSKNLNGMLQLNRKLNNMGRNITMQLNAGWSDGLSKSASTSLVQYYELGITNGDETINRYAITPTKNWNYSARLTYSEPILPRTYLQFSYQYEYRYQKSDRGTYDFSNFAINPLIWDGGYRSWTDYLAQYGSPVSLEPYKDANQSRFSEYQNYIHTAEVMLRIVRNAYTFNVGVQMVPQKSHFTQDYMGHHTDTTRTVTNFSPTMDFRWKRSMTSQLRFTYRANTGQPSMSDLLDFMDNSDPLNKTKGNPGLKPSFTQNFNLFYNDYIQKHQRAVMTFVNFSTTANAIANKVTLLEDGSRLSMPQNINGNWNANVGFMFNTAIDSAGYFNVNTFTNLGYRHNVGFVNDGNSDAKAVTKTITMMERLAASYRNDWFEIELNGSVNYNRNRSELQTNNNLDTWQFSYGGMIGVTAPWGTSLTTNMNMQSRRGYYDASMNTNELIWNAQLSQSFLKGRPLTLSLQLYDILHQQSTISSTVSAMMRSDTEYNAITSYAMLHVIYRLNLFGGKAGRQSGFGGPGAPGAPGRGRFGGGFGGGRPRGGGFGGPRMF